MNKGARTASDHDKIEAVTSMQPPDCIFNCVNSRKCMVTMSRQVTRKGHDAYSVC